MLAGVVEIDNLRGARKVQADKIPNPFGAVANHDLLECTTPATSPSFGIDSPAKLFRTLDGSCILGGIVIADWIAFLIPLRLGEDASQFYFPSMGRLARALALPTDRLFLHHRNSRPIQLHVQDAHRLADNHGQVQLEGFVDLGLFALSDIGSDGLRGTLHGFGSHLQTGQNSPLFAAMSEGRSEEHTSELQSLTNLVCRLLLEKKNRCAAACSSSSGRSSASRYTHRAHMRPSPLSWRS